jgi:hypothetical protein
MRTLMKLRGSAPKTLQANAQSRRMFLKSAGGLTLSIPFLSSMLTPFSEKAMAATDAPLRYVSLFSAFGGLQHKNWFGTQLPTNPFQLYPGHTGRQSPIANLISNGALSPVLNSNFQNLWPYANVIAGADQPYYFGHNRGIPLGGITASINGMPWISDQGDLSKPGILTCEYPTVDQVLGYANGNGIYGLGLGGRKRHLNITTTWASSSWGRDDYTSQGHVTAKEFLGTTSGIFSYLFGSVEAGGANPLLNLVNEFWPSGRALMKLLSRDDRDSIDKLFSLAQQAANDYSLPGPNISGITAPSTLTTNVPMQPADLATVADLIAMAFKADVTRIVNIHCETVVNGYDFHAVSHAPESRNVDGGQSNMVEIYQNQANNLFARLGNNLLASDPFDPQSTILKNSLIHWTHENKAAHHMNCTPTLLLGEAGGRIASGNFTDLRNLGRPLEVDIVGDQLYVGDMANRLWASIFYAFNIPRSTYEVARGGNADTVALTKGYGHVMKVQPSWYSIPDYDLSRIGEPWEFLTKSGVSWG